MKPRNYWTKERIAVVAKKCKTRGEFSKKYKRAYTVAKIMGIFSKLCSHMRVRVLKLTDEEIMQSAKKYSYKKDWLKSAPNAYWTASTRKILNNCTKHMKVLGNRKFKRIYIIKNPDNSVYVGLTGNVEKRYREHTAKNSKQKVDKILRKHYLQGMQTIKEFPKLYANEQAVIKEAYWIARCKKEGYNVLNTAKAGALGSTGPKKTFEECKSLVKKVKSRKEYFKEYKSHYYFCSKNKLLKKLFIDMPWAHKIHTMKELKITAKKCSTRGEFFSKFPRQYRACVNRKILKKITKHMPINNRGRPVVCIQNGTTYSSCTAAALDLKMHKVTVNRLCRLGRTSEKGLSFRYA
jgi:predicted GIY-YIG superfamily endonuclease